VWVYYCTFPARKLERRDALDRRGASDVFLEDYSFGKDERTGFAVSLMGISGCRLGQMARRGTRAEKCPGFISGFDRKSGSARTLLFRRGEGGAGHGRSSGCWLPLEDGVPPVALDSCARNAGLSTTPILTDSATGVFSMPALREHTQENQTMKRIFLSLMTAIALGAMGLSLLCATTSCGGSPEKRGGGGYMQTYDPSNGRYN
jgi:hypothetical protein